ncbi:hypothetical protein [Streptosporangium pseudovulgare]|uniref:Uncharacterized protein n=1 Tax=Streptosporangium pseudovulgare TaxID=35765 RepID=A0ABQ2QK84_9ACTN|nr:hypothetical protein [Streptosporangium pseudovulgare]GGP84362.1 hypothetical protein GCM10010140_11800 [Streptosporangium pseudovulgare]
MSVEDAERGQGGGEPVIVGVAPIEQHQESDRSDQNSAAPMQTATSTAIVERFMIGSLVRSSVHSTGTPEPAPDASPVVTSLAATS